MKCDKQVSKDTWHWHPCGKPAKWVVRRLSSETGRHLCGVHARFYKQNPLFEVIPTDSGIVGT